MVYKHILFPTDGSERSQKALPHIIAIAKAFQAEVTVICVYQQLYTVSNNVFSLPTQMYDLYKKANEAEAKKIADAMVKEFSNVNIDATSLVLEGNAKKLICSYAQKLSCDLIVLGTRGHSEASGYLGSTSAYVMNNTKNIPVLVVS